jgi:hypothetical protein
MRIDYYLSSIACLAVPLAFSVWWVRMKLGRDKRWFVMPGYYISRNFYFALPFFTLGMLIGTVDIILFGQDPYRSVVPLLVAFGFWGLAFVFAYLEPDWLAPTWYRWLKREHGNILSLLAQEAHQLGRAEWLKHVQTQADLEAWVAEVRKKHRLE